MADTRIELGGTLTLEVDGYEGVVVKARKAAQIRDFRMMRRLDALSIDDDAALDELDAGLRDFGDRFLIDWNINVEGEPIEANGENLLRLPSTFQLGLLHAWAKAARVRGGVDAPLGSGSPNGSTSKADSEATEAP